MMDWMSKMSSEGRKMSAEERAKTPYLDYMRPIIADGDTGYVKITLDVWLEN